MRQNTPFILNNWFNQLIKQIKNDLKKKSL